MARTITLIKGDGTGPEIVDATVKVIEATGVKINWEAAEAGEIALKKYGTPLPEATLESIRKNKIALKGPITTPIGTGFRSVNVALRKQLELYACVRPCKYYPGVKSKYTNVNLVIVRENMEDLYAGIEFEQGGEKTRRLIDFIAETEGSKIPMDSGISIKPISIKGTERIVDYAFKYAQKYGRKKVTAVTKANIMKHSDGLFMRTAEGVSKKYPGIQYEHVLVDNMCMQLVQKPELYDVLVLPNLYGDIISDLCAGLVGGLGVAAGANIGNEYAVFEATHGSAPKYAGLNKVNPTAVMLSGVLMLRHMGEEKAADKMENAIAAVIKEGRNVTYDLKPSRDDPTAVGTKQMGEAIVEKMR